MPELHHAAKDARAILESAHVADALLGQLQDAIVVTDADLRIVYVNAAYERLLGWSRHEAIGRPVAYRFPADVQAQVTGFVNDVMLGQSYASDFHDYRADQSRRWIHWRSNRMLDADGRIVGAVSVGTDITERKRIEAEHEQLQQQLYQAQKLDTLGTLAGGIAHDFNNILAIIVGFTELALARDAPDAPTRPMHEQVLAAGHRGRELVNRILSFSRFHHPERRPVSVAEVLTDAARFIRATIPSTIDVVTDLPPTCPPTLADANQLHQVLLNLATNAAHAMRNHHGVFTVKLRVSRLPAGMAVAAGAIASGDYLVIEATDTGTGMDAATQRRIFEPFFTTKPEGEGTGLGLSVVRAMIEGHNGAIDVVSAPGCGSTFRIFLPVVAGVSLPACDDAEPFTPRLRARGETIAVIDDDEALMSVTERALQSLGYSTVSYSAAEKFHAAFLTAPAGINLLVTDQTMPGMTGLELARRLRADGHALPILLMTGFSKQLRPELVQQLGQATLLRKPFNRTTLARAIRDLLDALPDRRCDIDVPDLRLKPGS